MSLKKYREPSSGPGSGAQTEFEILKASHKFLREDDGTADPSTSSWNDRLAAKFYSQLYREFAVCNLKHYKTGQFALRWRTEDEVISGVGENSCGNTRCELHPTIEGAPPLPGLTTLELPFAYMEHGEAKEALVKVVLCEKCVKKLMWKREQEKEGRVKEDESKGKEGERKRHSKASDSPHRRRSSRSRSPRRSETSRRRRSRDADKSRERRRKP